MFIKLSEQDIESIENVRGWLYRVGTNILKNRVKRGAKFKEIIRLILDQTENLFYEDREIELKSKLIRKGLKKLPFDQRILISLYREGFSYREISNILEIKSTSVGKMVSRAIDRLREEIGDQYEMS